MIYKYKLRAKQYNCKLKANFNIFYMKMRFFFGTRQGFCLVSKENDNKVAYLRGLARTRCPIVTKLLSLLDINQPSDDTLEEKKRKKLAGISGTR
jgi:hypothetical protein